jgi:hypothetical protein
MALFTDGPISNGEDLQRYESDILNVATNEHIDLGAKLRLAQQNLSDELVLFLLRRWPLRDAVLGFERARKVDDVVVSDPLRRWHIHQTLALIYRDAYNNQLNDRYQGKWKEYEQLAAASKSTYLQIGVGLVSNPVSRGMPPTLASVTGPGTGATYYVAVTWVNAGGQQGAPSEFAEFTTTNGQELTAQAGPAPQNATGWNVYVGTSPATATLQNQTPLTAGAVWTMNNGLNAGARLPQGQLPSWFVVDQRVVERG